MGGVGRELAGVCRGVVSSMGRGHFRAPIVNVRPFRIGVQVVPASGHHEQHLRMDATVLGGLFDVDAGFLEHLRVLLAALRQRPLDLRRVQRVRLRQHRQRQFRSHLSQLLQMKPLRGKQLSKVDAS